MDSGINKKRNPNSGENRRRQEGQKQPRKTKPNAPPKERNTREESCDHGVKEAYPTMGNKKYQEDEQYCKSNQGHTINLQEMNYSRLQEAVIMSEVLGQPVSRKRRNGMRRR